jgi:acyl-CoA thioester hydrolase
MATHYTARLHDADETVATGTAVLVWVSADTGEPVPIPDMDLR